MKPFCISLMSIAAFANHIDGNHEQDVFNKVRGFYDEHISVACNTDLNDNAPINHLINSLCDEFEYCEIKGIDGIDEQQYSQKHHNNCLNKDEYIQYIKTEYRGKYKDAKYSVNIDEDIDNDKYLQLTTHWTLHQNECTVTSVERSQIYSKDDGTITKVTSEVLDYNEDCSPASQHGYKAEYLPKDTPPSDIYTPLRPVQPILPDQPVRQYENIHIGLQIPNPLDGGYMEVTNSYELEQIKQDIDMLAAQNRLYEQNTYANDVTIALHVSKAWSLSISTNAIRYRCLLTLEGEQTETAQYQVGAPEPAVYVEYDVVTSSYKPYQSEPKPHPLPRYNNLPEPSSGGYTVNNKPEELDYKPYVEKEEKASLPPKAKDDYVMTMKNEGVLVDVLLNDINLNKPKLSGKKTLIIKEFTNGKKGIVVKLGNKLKYLPNRDQCGKDIFVYTIAGKDNKDGLTDTAQVYVTIDCPYVGNQYVPEQPQVPPSQERIPEIPDTLPSLPPSSGSQGPELLVPPPDILNKLEQESEGGLNSLLNKYSDLNKEKEEVVPSTKPNPNEGYKPEIKPKKEVNNLIKKEREYRLKEFYGAGFECRLKSNSGDNTKINKFLKYLSDDTKFCVDKKMNGVDYTCFNKDEIKTKMGAGYSDDNKSIDYDVIILSNDGNSIKSKCTSERIKSSGCKVIKEEYSSCSFDDKGLIKEFKIERSNKRTVCDDDDKNY